MESGKAQAKLNIALGVMGSYLDKLQNFINRTIPWVKKPELLEIKKAKFNTEGNALNCDQDNLIKTNA